ncbi:hypothetical protein [Puniceibacterium sp. IMCC21224]|uniref:hypothetical protein n=1 Tax=Puniceibacterium sp. IMCC21224 TaxID=1618204 RepID=UPI00065D10E6|nr:hypothetical protein [Puniceibacterium sp. IMCC21224]KMK68332.1 hypothetical protein IMCC21224_113213 [Puniceibacterium sp. IMCC21224]
MSLGKQHEIHRRRFSRNLGVGLTLGAFMLVIFGLTIVKVSRGDYEPTRAPAAQEQN